MIYLPALNGTPESVSLESYVFTLIKIVLIENSGNVSKSAKHLKISRSTLYRYLKYHKVDAKKYK